MTNIANLNLNLLRVFVTVFETGNVTRAAEQLGMSQSAVSGKLARLSDQLGEALFERKSGGVEPTEAAKRLFDPVSDALHAFSSGLIDVPGSQAFTTSRHFRIALQNLAESTICGPSLDELGRIMPNATIEIVPPIATKMEPELLAGTLDLAFHVGDSSPVNHPDIIALQPNVSHWVCITRKGWTEAHGEMDVEKIDRFGAVVVDNGRVEDIPILQHESRNMSPPVCIVDRGWAIPAIIAKSDHVAAVPLILAGTFADRFGLELHRVPFDYRPLPFYMLWHKRSDKDHLHQQLRKTLMVSGRPLRDKIHNNWSHLIAPAVN